MRRWIASYARYPEITPAIIDAPAVQDRAASEKPASNTAVEDKDSHKGATMKTGSVGFA